MEDVNECERNPCFPGVQCFNSFGSYSCGLCPKGMLGNGTTCNGKMTQIQTSLMSEDAIGSRKLYKRIGVSAPSYSKKEVPAGPKKTNPIDF